MKIKNIYLALKDQGPISRFFRNLKNGHVMGLFSIWSHVTKAGKPKISYPSKRSATKAAEAMRKKYNGEVWFSNYKCMRCDGYHVGKNRSAFDKK